MPLIVSVALSIGVDPRAGVMGVLIAGSTSILTPMATPIQAMLMAPSGYEMKDYLKCGIPLVVVISIITIFGLPLLYPFY